MGEFPFIKFIKIPSNPGRLRKQEKYDITSDFWVKDAKWPMKIKQDANPRSSATCIYTWNPTGAPCFGWSLFRPCFEGIDPSNIEVTKGSRYISPRKPESERVTR